MSVLDGLTSVLTTIGTGIGTVLNSEAAQAAAQLFIQQQQQQAAVDQAIALARAGLSPSTLPNLGIMQVAATSGGELVNIGAAPAGAITQGIRNIPPAIAAACRANPTVCTALGLTAAEIASLGIGAAVSSLTTGGSCPQPRRGLPQVIQMMDQCGRPVDYVKRGRAVLYGSDFQAAKRVQRIAGRARRRSGRATSRRITTLCNTCTRPVGAGCACGSK